MRVSEQFIESYRERYRRASRKRKSELLTDFCEFTAWHRKAATRRLGKRAAGRPSKAARRGRKSRYDRKEFVEALKRIWFLTEQMCSKLLRGAIPEWLPHVEQEYGRLSDDVREDLLRISPATIDRLLKPTRVKFAKSPSGTKPGTMLRTEIPIRAGIWEEEHPGFLEADTVAHCGNSMAGCFVWSLTMTDIATHWTENRAVWHKGAKGVLEAVQDIENMLPFPIRGFDCDNGGEFVNRYLVKYFTEEHPRKNLIQLTRSREYRKNDNAHVEQRNWSHPRQLFGRERFDFFELVTLMNDIYRNEFSLLRNHFYPTMKLKEKLRLNSRYRRKYHHPVTPYLRVINSGILSDEQQHKLINIHRELNPLALRRALESKLNKFWHLYRKLKQTDRLATNAA
jgi:hypothetical protein